MTACGGTPATQPPATDTSSMTQSASSAPSSPAVTESASASESASPAPIAGRPACTQSAVQEGVNADREPSKQLVVNSGDFRCQDTWATAGANDLVNKAQYTFVLRWTGERWQLLPDRTGPCLRHQVPAQLYALACQSN